MENVKNKLPDVRRLVTNTAFNSKIVETEKKIERYITTQEVNSKKICIKIGKKQIY